MGLRFTAASRRQRGVSTWGLKKVFHRPAANFPGKMALYVDRSLSRICAASLDRGSVRGGDQRQDHRFQPACRRA